MKKYKVFVMDPLAPQKAAGFTVTAINEDHAEQQGKDGYTGLLGNFEEIQERLKVKVYE